MLSMSSSHPQVTLAEAKDMVSACMVADRIPFLHGDPGV